MRSVFPFLYGNAHLKSIFGTDIETGRLGHAYILQGPKGSGKHTAAQAIAAAASCENRNDGTHALPCGACLSCRKIREGVSPDVLFVKREEGRTTMGVNVIRKLREDLYWAPNENDKKVYIIEDADTMTPEAQNALLLSLESPPPYVLFLLLAQDDELLLETVRSRAPTLCMQSFDATAMASHLVKTPRFAEIARGDSQKFAEAISASGGTLGQAILYLSENEEFLAHLSFRADTERFISLLFSQSAKDTVAFLTTISKKREDVVFLLELVMTALRDLLAVKKAKEPDLLFYKNEEECRPLSSKISVARISAVYNDVFAARNDIVANAPPLPTCTALLTAKH